MTEIEATEIEALKQQVGVLKKALDGCTEKRGELGRELEEQKKLNTRLETANAGLREELRDVQRQADLADEALAEEKETNTRVESERSELERRLNRLSVLAWDVLQSADVTWLDGGGHDFGVAALALDEFLTKEAPRRRPATSDNRSFGQPAAEGKAADDGT